MPEPFIDCHVHLAALPDGANGCLISDKMLGSPVFRFLLWRLGLPRESPTLANQRYLDLLLAALTASRHVTHAVLLAMDGVYDIRGQLDRRRTEFHIPNDYVLNVARRYPRQFLAGASINPQRRDAVDEVHRCADAGAVLVKTLPNTQQFDPGRAQFKPFYRALAERRLPLLSHLGYEFSLAAADQSLGEPGRLRFALEEGVTVIGAHACSYGRGMGEPYLPTCLDLASRFPSFYLDVAAVTLPHRSDILRRLRDLPQLHPRLLFGTDYPLPVWHLPAWGRVEWSALRGLIATTNPFDRQYELLRSLGIPCGSLAQLMRRD